MRTICRDIVGGFIFSRDGRVLLGKNRKGGVYEGSFVVPGGGIDEGETKLAALKREMLEETGINIDYAKVSELTTTSGGHEKILDDTHERVFVNMTFYNYRIQLSNNADEINVTAEDDWAEPQWFQADELDKIKLSEPTKHSLNIAGYLPR